MAKKSTEELFRQLTRITYKKESPILFETKGGFMDDGSIGENSAPETLKGIIFLNENYLFFKPFNEKTMYQIAILNILSIMKGDPDLGPSVKIQTNPTTGNLTVVMAGSGVSANLRLYNTIGASQLSKSEALNGTTLINFDMTDMPNGLYFLNIEVDGVNITKKITLAK